MLWAPLPAAGGETAIIAQALKPTAASGARWSPQEAIRIAFSRMDRRMPL